MTANRSSQRRTLIAGGLLGGGLLWLRAGASWAQAAPLKIVVGFPPGGSVDIVARLIADHMRGTLNRPVVIENKPGAGSRLGIEAVKHAAPDGNTVLLSLSGPMTLYPHVFSDLKFDVVKDFVPIAQICESDLALSVGNAVPVSTVSELREWLRKNPSNAAYASGGSGTTLHFTGALFAQKLGLGLVHVPYKGEAPAVADVLAGAVPMTFSTVQQVSEFHRAGRLKILATTGPTRSPLLPETLTLREAGVDMGLTTWYGLFGPAGMNPDQVRAIAAAATAASSDPRIAEQFKKLGLTRAAATGDELGRIQRAEMEGWGPIVKATGFTPTQ
ncbi:MAG: Bug family tripartite tricarboxylate transporter substrate binding protein [Burkholderiaceae bacterium]